MATGNFTKGDQFVADSASKVARVAAAAAGKVWTSNGVGQAPSWEDPVGEGPGGGTVTSVTMPASEFNVAGATADVVVTWDNQAIHKVLAGPTSGGDAAPTFRLLVANDLPDISATYLTVAAAAAGYQPLNAGLTSISGLTTTSYGRGFLTLADAAAAFTKLGLGSAAAAATGDFDAAGAAAAAQAASQPLNAVLTALGGSGMSVFPRNVHVNVTPVLSTAVSTEEDLMSYVLPGGTLATNKDMVEIEAWGAPSSNLIDKRVRLYFGATVIFDSGMEPFTTGSFQIRARVYRTGAATQVAVATWTGQVDVMTSPPNVTQRTSPNATLASDVTIKMTSTVDVGASAGDLRQSGLDVSVRRAA